MNSIPSSLLLHASSASLPDAQASDDPQIRSSSRERCALLSPQFSGGVAGALQTSLAATEPAQRVLAAEQADAMARCPALWPDIQTQAQALSITEPLLAGPLQRLILAWEHPFEALAALLANRLSGPDWSEAALQPLFCEFLMREAAHTARPATQVCAPQARWATVQASMPASIPTSMGTSMGTDLLGSPDIHSETNLTIPSQAHSAATRPPPHPQSVSPLEPSPPLRLIDMAMLDLAAILARDPSMDSPLTAVLHLKGFHALQTQRIAHALWRDGRKALALALSNAVATRLAVDIHPGAQLGHGLLLDHATGLVIGETAVVGNDVSFLHNVTLGGTGKEQGDRHPKVRDGVLFGAGATVLGNIEVGAFSKVAAGSVVLSAVPAHATVAGVPARVVRRLGQDKVPGIEMRQTL